MNFGQALEALKVGNKIARIGWNGKGMWLHIVKPSDTHYQPYIEMRTVQGTFVPWLASQTDVLMSDWGIIDSTGALVMSIVGKEQDKIEVALGEINRKLDAMTSSMVAAVQPGGMFEPMKRWIHNIDLKTAGECVSHVHAGYGEAEGRQARDEAVLAGVRRPPAP